MVDGEPQKKKTQGLEKQELAFRSELNRLERGITFDGIIPRKQYKQFKVFLTNDNPRIRVIAERFEKESSINQSLASIESGKWDKEAYAREETQRLLVLENEPARWQDHIDLHKEIASTSNPDHFCVSRGSACQS